MTEGRPARPAFVAKPPLKPQKKLFVALLVVLAIWIAVLLTLFFTTVWPIRHSLTATQPSS